jgi:hypothetical protein
MVGFTMSATADILFGVASQSLTFDCPDGRPSSVTSVTVYQNIADDDSTAETATTGSGSVETNPNTTLSAAAGISETNPRSITVASGTGISVGRIYRLASVAGEYEDVEIMSVNSTALTVRHPLRNDYAVTTSTLKSNRVSISLSDTWVASTNNLSPTYHPQPKYRVRWVLVVNGVTKIYDTYFDLVRYAAQHHVSPIDVAARSPDWLDWLAPDQRDDQGRDLIRRAWNEVKFDLYGEGKADQALRNAEARDKLVIDRALLLAVEDRVLAGAPVSADAIKLARDVYERRFNSLIRSPNVAIDRGGGGASTVRPTAVCRR